MPLPNGTFIGCVQGEKIYGTWKPPGNADQRALHGAVRAIKIIPYTNNPLNMSKLAGKLIEVTGRFDQRNDAIISPSNISIIGNCSGASFTGCVVESELLVRKTTLGQITIEPGSWDQIYATELMYGKEKIDIAPFEGKFIRVTATGMEGSRRVESVTVSPSPGIETAGACDPKTGLLAFRASQLYEGKAEGYMQKKDWQGALSHMDKSITLAPDNCWKYKKRKDIYLALDNVENAVIDLQHFTETLCATPADREELRRLRSRPGVPGEIQR
jgi:tetratricopeptide (TPR) repeat protein